MKQDATNELEMRTASVIQPGWAGPFWVGLLVTTVTVSMGCQRGGGEEYVPAPLVQASGAPTVDAPEPNGQKKEAVLFEGKNLLEGVWEELRNQENLEPADNYYCYVCHANYQTEELTQTHLPMGVGCELCHGMSDEHSADEDGLIPPEIMWPKEWINVTCMECHPQAELARNVSHRDFLARPEPGESCMDCHGEEHRLNVRTRIWDRITGELLECDGVRMMDADSPAGAAF